MLSFSHDIFGLLFLYLKFLGPGDLWLFEGDFCCKQNSLHLWCFSGMKSENFSDFFLLNLLVEMFTIIYRFGKTPNL
jgi:hypothetical protein